MRVTADDVRLDKITCPVLILAGEDDPVTPAADSARRMAASVQQAAIELHVLADVGHGVFRQPPSRTRNAGRGPRVRRR